MDSIKDANLLLRFLLELGALGAIGWAGWRFGGQGLRRWSLAIGAPLVVATFWALFVAPDSTIDSPNAMRVLLQLVVFGSAALALTKLGRRTPAALFSVVVIANAALMLAWNQ
jgi:hypothetical protein